MSQIYEEDALNAGKDQLIISNNDMKVIIVPELGGRIADIETGNIKFLHRTYPEGVAFGPYTEYGGLEECIGSAPGSLWNARWRWEKKDNRVILQSLSKGILVQKSICLDDAMPVIRIEYSFRNLGDNFSKFTFGIHPEVCIGNSLKDNQYHVPAGNELFTGGYTGPGFKNKVLPSEGWCAISCTDKVFGQMFPEGIIDAVEVYFPKVNTHLVLEPIIYGVGVSPDKCASFTYMIYIGDGDAEKIREIRASLDADFSVRYELFDRAELPEDVTAELGEIAKVRDEGELAARLKHDVETGTVRLKAFGDVSGVGVDVKLSPAVVESSRTGKTEDLPTDTEININHLKGNITIHGWERPYIEYTDMRGNITQHEGVIRFETSGDCSLKVPREAPRIALNFVNGDIAVFDISSSLKIAGVKGKVDAVMSKVPDDGALDISLVNGDISLTIPGDSSCTISARSLKDSDIAVSDLPIQRSAGEKKQLLGVMKDGKAYINLNTIRGKISISGRPT